MRMIRALAALAFGLVATLGLPRGAEAQSATRFLRQRHERVNQILRQPAGTEAAQARRSEQLQEVLGNLLDYEALSRAALAGHWDERSEAERTEFVSLLRQLVRRNYESNLERILDYEITYGDEERRDGHTVVSTRARSRENRREPPVEIVYTMRREGRGYRVIDVETDEVSMVRNYRRQFHRIIRRRGWDELLNRMRRRLERGDDADDDDE